MSDSSWSITCYYARVFSSPVGPTFSGPHVSFILCLLVRVLPSGVSWEWTAQLVYWLMVSYFLKIACLVYAGLGRKSNSGFRLFTCRTWKALLFCIQTGTVWDLVVFMSHLSSLLLLKICHQYCKNCMILCFGGLGNLRKNFQLSNFYLSSPHWRLLYVELCDILELGIEPRAFTDLFFLGHFFSTIFHSLFCILFLENITCWCLALWFCLWVLSLPEFCRVVSLPHQWESHQGGHHPSLLSQRDWEPLCVLKA